MSAADDVARIERIVQEAVEPIAHRHGLHLRELDHDPRTVTVTWSGREGRVDVLVDRADGTVDTVVSPVGGGAGRSLQELAAALGDDDLARRLAAAAAPGCELGARLAHHASVLDATLGAGPSARQAGHDPGG